MSPDRTSPERAPWHRNNTARAPSELGTLINTTNHLRELEAIYGITLRAHQKRQISLYLALLAKWNRRLNLTTVDQTEKQLRIHFFEPFWAAKRFLPTKARVADVGSGAGFPGLAMKLYRPSLELTLIEKNYKKAVFLNTISDRLNLQVEVFPGAAEAFLGWKSIEVATLRALKPSHRLLERLSDCATNLLLFHGKELDRSVLTLEVLQQERVPESKHRYITLFHLPATPP